MSNSQIPDKSSGSILEKGIDLLKDPNVSKAAKVGAVGIVAIGAITFLASETLTIMGKIGDAK